MPVAEDVVTDAQVAQLRVLVAIEGLTTETARTELAARSASVLQRDPTTGEVLQGATGPLRQDVVDVYGAAAQLWEERAWRLLGDNAGAEARQVRSESNGDVSRSYGEGGGPMTHAKAMAVAKRLWRRALAKPQGTQAKVVEMLPPNYQRGYDPSDPSLWQPTYQDPAPAQLNAPYVVNRPEPGT